MKLKILVGTMTSTADYVAQAIQMDCADLCLLYTSDAADE